MLSPSELIVDVAKAALAADGLAVLSLSGSRVFNAEDPEKVILAGRVVPRSQLGTRTRPDGYPVTGMGKVVRDDDGGLHVELRVEFLGAVVDDPFDMAPHTRRGDW